jgi:hypothetical protein
MSNNTLTMLLVGDMALGTPGEPLFALAAPVLKTADVLVGQGEIPFTLRGITPHVNLTPPLGAADATSGLGEDILNSGITQPPTAGIPMRGISSDPANLKTLAEVGFNVLHLAGNHSWDAGLSGVEDTITSLRKNGIAFTGSGMNIEEAKRAAIIERNGIRFGFLSYNCVGPVGSWAAPDKPGCAYVHIVTAYEQYELIGGYPTIYTFAEPGSLEAMIEDIQKLRPLCDVLVVHFHKGMAFIPVRLAMYEKQISHAAIIAGADLVVGDHAHMLKGIEQYKGKWIFHNLGDFVWHHYPDYTLERLARFTRDHGGPFFFGPEHKAVSFPHNPEQKMTIIVKCIIDNGKITRVTYLPCYPNEQHQVEILKHDERGQKVFDYIDNITRGAALNTKFEWIGDEVALSAR